MDIGGGTRVYALLGDPVSHSLSPAMQNAAFRSLGLDAVYVALRCEESGLGALMDTLVRQGGGGNVTIPHKEAAAQVLASRGSSSGPTCNTFWGADEGLCGAETDSTGILAALSRLDAPSGPWCLIGTGGSARAAVEAARRANVGIAVRSRTPGRVQEFNEAVRATGLAVAEPQSCAVVINCTPLGLAAGDPLPALPADLPAARVALDLVYRPGETRWIHAMRHAGCVAADGREVLVEQGAAAFECWFPKRSAPRDVMWAAVRAALA